MTPNSNCTSAQASKSGQQIAGILRDGSVQRSVILDSVTQIADGSDLHASALRASEARYLANFQIGISSKEGADVSPYTRGQNSFMR